MKIIKKFFWRFDCATWLIYYGFDPPQAWEYSESLWFENNDPRGLFYEPDEDWMTPYEAVRSDMEHWET